MYVSMYTLSTLWSCHFYYKNNINYYYWDISKTKHLWGLWICKLGNV